MLQPILRPVIKAANDRLRGGSPIVLPQPPLLDLDFVGRPSLTYPGLPALTFTRADAATCATYRNAAGVRVTAAANEPRWDHDANGNRLGLLIEESRTNYLLNSTAPATQTTGSLGTGSYTLWVEGSGSAEVAANGATITGAGTATEGSPVTFTVTGAGTVDVTVTGDVDVFQLENGAFATSLIVTAGATATRAADSATMATDAAWFNATEGTLLADADLLAAASGAAYIFASFNDGTANNEIDLRVRASNIPAGFVTTSTVAQGNVQAAASGPSPNIPFRLAVAYKADDLAASAFGSAPGTDTSATLPTVTRLELGAFGGANRMYGHIRRIAYWPTRLPNGVVQALTR